MRLRLLLLISIVLLTGFALRAEDVRWELKFTEEFKGNKLNEKLWTRIDKWHPDWCRNMSLRPDLVTVSGGQLHCWGKRNEDKSSDPRAVLTGGVMTKGKFAMRYGKVEFKMKLDDGQKGAWPAVWMMPETAVKGWPNDDELKFPWTTPFYLMIDMQLGGSWVGAVDESTLPTAMHVDWVKFYHGSRNGKRFSEFVNPRKSPRK